jgi:serine/threonine protein kinase
MVEFGKTLNEVVKRDWRCHAVAYIELKRALSSGEHCKQPAPIRTAISSGGEGEEGKQKVAADCCDHSVHTESSFQVTDEQKDDFFRIYNDSIRRLANFYADRVHWATEEMQTLETAVERVNSNSTSEHSNNKEKSSSVSFLMHRITQYSKDLGLVLEFLNLNATAFSKIMKKYDKRTGSMLREIKIKELMAQHPYIYDGGELKTHQNIAAEWIKQLQKLLDRDEGAAAAAGSVNEGTTGSKRRVAHLNVRNSLVDENEPELENPQGTDNADNSTSDGADTISTKPKKEGSVRFKVGTKEPRPTVETHHTTAHGSIHKTKDSQLLLNMIEKVNEELCLQQADSPFFDEAAKFESPPSFSSSEIQLAKLLGEGEFCKIFEVSKFDVPESCHICFLHRGFNDPRPSSKGGGGGGGSDPPVSSSAEGSKQQTRHSKVPSSVFVNINDVFKEGNQEEGEVEEFQMPSVYCAPTNTTQHQRQTSIFGTFEADENISDYDELESDHEDEVYYRNNTRGFMKDHCLRNGEARYAVKRIRHDLVGEEEITDAAIDLAREAQFLAGLSHPNIIRIRGTCNVPGHPKYCIILDRLYDTLEVQMLKWKAQVKHHQGRFKGMIGKNVEELNKIWLARLLAAYDMAHALSYLHKRGVIHRDIKPANIGFDIRGDIKIFDFGLAKELKPSEREGHDQYHTSGIAGTRRYMAPEVAQVSPYGLSADMYSFAILFWEMLALKTAFQKYDRNRHYKEVIVEGKRPKLSKSWPFVIKDLLQRCWAPKASERPTFQAACELIKFGLPDQSIRSDRSADSLMRRSSKSVHKDSLKTTLPPVPFDSYHSESDHPIDNRPDELSASIKVKCDSVSDSISTSIHIKSKNLQKKN